MEGRRHKLIWAGLYACSFVFVLLGTVTAWYFYEKQSREQVHEQARSNLQQELNQVTADLEAEVRRSTDALKAMSNLVVIEPNMSHERFAAIGETLFEGHTAFRLVGLAPDLVMSHVYPFKGNEGLVGLNYRNLPEQQKPVEKALASKNIVIGGPISLNAGGTGLIVRKAVYVSDPITEEDKLWGMASLVIDFDVMIRQMGLPHLPFELAIRGRDSTGAVGDVFYGDPPLFGQRPVTSQVALPIGRWWAGALPRGGWALPQGMLLQIRTNFLLVGFALFGLMCAGLRLVQLRFRAVAQLTNAINSIDDGFALYDSDDRLVTCNDKYKELYSVSADLFVPGAKFSEIIRRGIERGQYPEAEGCEAEFLQERLRRHREASGVIEQQLDDGRWLKIAESRTQDGSTVGFRVDITELKNAKEVAERANRAKSEFLDVMSHELRTPLTVVLGGTPFLCKPEMLPAAQKLFKALEEKGEVGKEVQADVDELLGSLKNLAGKVERSAKHLLTLINEVLDFSKIEAGRMDMSVSEVDLTDLVEDLLDEFTFKADAKSLKLANDLDDQMVRADELRLRQVLINILGNAIKFTDSGHIRVSGEDMGKMYKISVSDTGCGIPSDRLDAVFEKFTQLDSSSRRKAGGTGLGMAITRKIVELHGGKIWVESRLNEGSTFSFTIPKADAPKSANVDASKSNMVLESGTA